jgi:hypothetical protein
MFFIREGFFNTIYLALFRILNFPSPLVSASQNASQVIQKRKEASDISIK